MGKLDGIIPNNYRFKTALGWFTWEPEPELLRDFFAEFTQKITEESARIAPQQVEAQKIEKEMLAAVRLFFRTQLILCFQHALFQAADESYARAIRYAGKDARNAKKDALGKARERAENRIGGFSEEPDQRKKRGRPVTVEMRLEQSIRLVFQRAHLVETLASRLEQGLPVTSSGLANALGMGDRGEGGSGGSGARMVRTHLKKLGKPGQEPGKVLADLIAQARTGNSGE
ncbi:MAG: hypothetical protein HOP19_15745 [Acidobacteria bacterium]|nr:hypothetical protein [Acidobacteriota bacterium]